MSTLKTIEIHLNPNNPRTITKQKYKELVESIERSPHFMTLHPLIVNEDRMILSGNNRYRACKELFWKEIPANIFTKANHKKSKAFTKYKRTYEECCDEIIIKTNTHAGEFDMAILANTWDTVELLTYGVDVWNPDKEIEDKPRCELCDQILKS